MEEIDVFKSMRESVDGSLVAEVDEREAARLKLIAEHKAWLKNQERASESVSIFQGGSLYPVLQSNQI